MYSQFLKDKLNYSQAEINHIATALDVGLYVAVPGAVFFDYYGPLPTVLVSVVFAVGGFLALYFASIGRDLPLFAIYLAVFVSSINP